MSRYILTYDERVRTHNYQRLYDLLISWNAAHLQNSVWLLSTNATAAQVRDAMQQHMHSDDTICVIQIQPSANWATRNARKTGIDFLQSFVAA